MLARWRCYNSQFEVRTWILNVECEIGTLRNAFAVNFRLARATKQPFVIATELGNFRGNCVGCGIKFFICHVGWQLSYLRRFQFRLIWFKPSPSNDADCFCLSSIGTINSSSDYTLWTFYRSFFMDIRANIELQVYSVTCCWPYRTSGYAKMSNFSSWFLILITSL
jgi:hypothetical protein